jgi:hypothetical protein
MPRASRRIVRSADFPVPAGQRDEAGEQRGEYPGPRVHVRIDAPALREGPHQRVVVVEVPQVRREQHRGGLDEPEHRQVGRVTAVGAPLGGDLPQRLAKCLAECGQRFLPGGRATSASSSAAALSRTKERARSSRVCSFFRSRRGAAGGSGGSSPRMAIRAIMAGDPAAGPAPGFTASRVCGTIPRCRGLRMPGPSPSAGRQ